jgi:NagD protein
MSLEVSKDKIMTSGIATAFFANSSEKFKGKKAFLLGNEFLKEELEENGVLIDNKNPDFLIVGFDTTLDYKKMTDACTLVRNGIPFIATHPDSNCPTEFGDIPDIGAILAFIKESTQREPEAIVGKPNRYIIDTVLETRNLEKNSVAMVGDRLYTDIKTGLLNDITSILVMSGETDEKMLETTDIKPDFVFKNLKAIGEAL